MCLVFLNSICGVLHVCAMPLGLKAIKLLNFWTLSNLEIHEFLTFQQYPNGFSKNQKRVLRRRNQNHFRVKRGCSFIPVCPRLKLMMQRDKAKGWIRSGDSYSSIAASNSFSVPRVHVAHARSRTPSLPISREACDSAIANSLYMLS